MTEWRIHVPKHTRAHIFPFWCRSLSHIPSNRSERMQVPLLRVFQDTVLRVTLWPRREEGTGGWRNSHKESPYSTPHLLFREHKMKEYEMIRASGTNDGEQKCVQSFGGETWRKEGSHLKDLDVDESKINSNLNKHSGKTRTGVFSLRTETSDGILETRKWTFGLHQM